ncbi:uncharacterized protein LOC143179629 [Calliopsis andreniformis]|uniref:uncharacterized protein LOC143179629 n=1 Tax=Calliopsis andreniformis TaxID=337506 RepID=UPI003FCD0641
MEEDERGQREPHGGIKERVAMAQARYTILWRPLWWLDVPRNHLVLNEKRIISTIDLKLNISVAIRKLDTCTKTHLDEKEVKLKSQVNEETKENIEVVSTNIESDSLKLENNEFVTDKNIDSLNSITNTTARHLTIPIVDIPERDMETVWNKDVNVTSTLFPNSQSLVMQRLDDQTMNLSENIVTVQLEQCKLNEEEKSKFTESDNKGANEWNIVHDVVDSQKSDADVDNQISSKQCHDNNNNNAKSKAQPTSEIKKSVQKPSTKISTKKLGDQSTRKQAGNSLKESCIILKQGFKDKDDLMNSSINENKISTSSSKFSDKGGKSNGSNRLSIGKGTQMKDQQFYKQHFSTLNDSSSKNSSFIEGSDEKNKSQITKLKSSTNELDKMCNEVDDTRKCHKVQLTRVQSYNVQYIRNKSTMKSQQRYSKSTTKPEEENSIKHTSCFKSNSNNFASNEDIKKKSENQQTTSKQINDKQSGQTALGKSFKDLSISECSTKSSNSVSCKKSYQNLSNVKTNINRDVKDDQGCIQKFKKDFNTYRRSAGSVQMFSKDSNGKMRTDDYKRNVTDNNVGKDFKVNRICSMDAKGQVESSRITVDSHKEVNGASNTSKTDTSDSSSVNNVQSLSSCSSSTKDSTGIDTRTLQESQTLQTFCNETEVQFLKTEQENASINNSNKKPSSSNSEIKSVKFSDNVQEINTAGYSTISYTNNSMQQNKFSTNPFYSNLQNVSSISHTQRTENHQSVQDKNYFNYNDAQYNMSANVQNSERDLYLLDAAQQKTEQTSHMTPQSVSPHSCNSAFPVVSSLSYQNMPTMYLNQFNNVQAVPRKTTDTTIVSHNALIPSTSYTVENPNMLQSEPSSILMHNTQSSVLPPPGFHNHPVSTQPNQWNLPLPDMFLFGNVMNQAHPLNLQMQNSRHLCNTDLNNMQQVGYLQHPLVYVPQVCMQNWNPLMQYPAPLFQNPPFTNCSTFPTQALPLNNLPNSVNCSVSTSVQNNSYKQYQQMQQLENNPNFSVPMKHDSYARNVQGGKSNNIRMKDNPTNMRTNQYRNPVPNEYQTCSQDAQIMVPFSYAVAMDSIARNGSPNMHMQMNHKYAAHAANYQRMPETSSVFQNTQDTRKDDSSKIDSECVLPIVSPRDCMYGVSYSRKPDMVQDSSLRSTPKPVSYVQSVHSHQYVPQHQKNVSYQTSQREFTSRVSLGRGMRKMMEQ